MSDKLQFVGYALKKDKTHDKLKFVGHFLRRTL